MDSLAKGWLGNEHHFWGFINNNEAKTKQLTKHRIDWFFWDMPYYGRWHKGITEDFYWRASKNHIHYRYTKDYPSDRFKQWNITPKEYRATISSDTAWMIKKNR